MMTLYSDKLHILIQIRINIINTQEADTFLVTVFQTSVKILTSFRRLIPNTLLSVCYLNTMTGRPLKLVVSKV